MNDRTTLRTDLNVFADFKPKLPASYRESPYLILGNIQPSLQRSVREQMNGLRLAGGDTMNYWIKDYRDELLDTIRNWDFLLINDAEARMLSGESNLKKAAGKILAMGPHTLVIKRGEYGAMMVHAGGVFSVPAFPLEEVRDPTGAGDSFAGGFMGYLANASRMNDDVMRRAMVYGSVMGSFAVERFGLERIRQLKRREIDARARHFHKLTQFKLR